MQVSGLRTEGDLVDFLRREAPIELERLESIAWFAAVERDRVPGRPMPRESSYPAWLRATSGLFQPRISSEAVRTRHAPVAGSRTPSGRGILNGCSVRQPSR